VEDRRIKP